MGVCTPVFLGLLLAFMSSSVEGNCGQRYQSLLTEALALRNNCTSAVYYDCCQIKGLFSSSNTDTYEIGGVCNDSLESFHADTGSSKLLARCDMETDGGKWQLIQRRINGSVDFYRDWVDYVNGFGHLEGEFWYGLEKIHCLTTRDEVELRIEIGNGTEPSIVWTYQQFTVGGANTNYRLTIGGATRVKGSGEDAMAIHNGMAFTTKDRDNDRDSSNCAAQYGGAWWYNRCYKSNLNGKYIYHNNHIDRLYLLNWGHVHYTKVQMKIRRKSCNAAASTCDWRGLL